MKALCIIWALVLVVTVCHAEETGLPKPTGEYPVGITHLAFTDLARAEPFTEDPDDRREVTVTVWYPADRAGDDTVKAAPYYEHAEEIIARYGYLSKIADTRTHSVKGAPVSEKQAEYPVTPARTLS